MAVSEKIFIDLDEDIIFITEKIRKIQSDRIILIVPERAALLGSVVSLKLLFSEIIKSEKSVILVTNDEIGLKLAVKANLVAFDKVNKITSDSWLKVEDLKSKYLIQKENKKDSLVKERKEDVSVGKVSNEENKTEDKSLDSLKKMNPKKINISGFEMVSGGDIAEVEGEEIQKEKSNISEIENNNVSNKDIPSSEKDTEVNDKDSLVGADLSSFSYTSSSRIGNKGKVHDKKNILSSFFTKIKMTFENIFKGGGAKQKLGIGVLIFVIAFFTVSYFVLPKSEVLIKVQSEDIELEKEVIAKTDAQTLDLENLTIPAKQMEAIKDRSETADATGSKETGATASGQVTLFNLTDNPVTVNANTILESIETGLKYKIVSQVVVPVKKPDDDPESPGLIGNASVGITAESFGQNYNIDKKEQFRVAGLDIEKVYGKNFNNITGGTTETKKVVSKEDFDNLKKKLEELLKQDLVTSLQTEAGTSSELLLDTITYETINEDTSPAIDSEADTFNLSVTIKATALSFSKDDIDNLAQELVEKQNEQHIDVEEFDYESMVISSEGSQIKISLKITGIVTPSINEDDIKQNLLSKSKESGENYLESKSEIKSFEVKLSPTWLPEFLKHFPSSADRINLKIEKVKD